MSLLRDVQQHYRRECALRKLVPLPSLLLQLDHFVDHKLVLRSLALANVGLDDSMFAIVAAAFARGAGQRRARRRRCLV